MPVIFLTARVAWAQPYVDNAAALVCFLSTTLPFGNSSILIRNVEFELERLTDFEALGKNTRCCCEVERPFPWDLVAAGLLILGVDLVDRPFVEVLVLWLRVQPEFALQMKIHYCPLPLSYQRSRHNSEPRANCEIQSILLEFVRGIAVCDWTAKQV